MSIKVQHLTKLYGAQKAVNDISFSIGKGEIVGFLGPNGAGKSTTMKMITGYIAADAGDITVCNIPVEASSVESKKKIGYLSEANPLYPDMYVREYLEFIAGIHDLDEKKTKINAAIETVGLQREAHKKTGQLSKGYKQRVGLAAALLHDPEVLILDEPTSGLDPNQIIEIRNVIKSLAKEKTILFSTHILQEVEAICDRVIIISKGNIVADDNLQNLRNQHSGGKAVRVEFKTAVSKEKISEVISLQELEQINDHTFLIPCTDADTLKKNLLQFSVVNNLDVVSLQTQEQSLETVFKSLTKG
ncbi:MAG: gliding motility-associated ABC transporter ATP-binding subunit GldA [Ferruginibacter sp.]